MISISHSWAVISHTFGVQCFIVEKIMIFYAEHNFLRISCWHRVTLELSLCIHSTISTTTIVIFGVLCRASIAPRRYVFQNCWNKLQYLKNIFSDLYCWLWVRHTKCNFSKYDNALAGKLQNVDIPYINCIYHNYYVRLLKPLKASGNICLVI